MASIELGQGIPVADIAGLSVPARIVLMCDIHLLRGQRYSELV
jgi:hypothetical protein